jgi:outer membrane lipoprotein-sorting protein
MNGNRRFSFSIIGAALAALAAAHPTLAQNDGAGSTYSKNIPGPVPTPVPPPPPIPAPTPAPAAQAQPPMPEPAGRAQAAAPQQNNAVGAGWSTKFGTSAPESSTFSGSPQQVAVVEKINGYFNNMTNMEGSFLQTDADEKRKKGRFYIERPGKLRFDYSLPSKQKIISDGKYLAIEDLDMNTTDRYPLESTPFRLLLTKDVDLVREARIIALDIGKDVVVITVEDKTQDSGGQIRLFFDWPELKLREWIISDPQGLNTRIQVADVELNKAVKPEVFKFTPGVGMPKFTPGGG